MASEKDKLTKLSASLLPIEDIKNLLYYEHDFMRVGDNATDVDAVAGIEADKIAVAVSKDNRETIKNSLHLGGKPAEEYLTVDDGGQINTNYNRIRDTYSSEIRHIKDELYQLKSDLARKGLVTNYDLYSGFQDTFKYSDPVYLKDEICSITKDAYKKDEVKIPEFAFNDFDVDDYIVLHLTEPERYHVARITQKMPDGETIKFSPSCSYEVREGSVAIYKSIGMYDDGTFAFMKQTENIPGTKEMHSVLNDDTYRTRRKLTQPGTGFATTFRIPTSMQGFLVRITAKVTRYGNPGPLTAYVIHEDDIGKFKNPAQAEEDGILIAKSAPVSPKKEQDEDLLDFEFFDGRTYPLIKSLEDNPNSRFCLIIATDPSDKEINEDTNYYRLMFLQHKQDDGSMTDLQLNNIVYTYTRKEAGSDEKALITDSNINQADLYYGIVTREVITKGIEPYREGVYTAKVKLPEPHQVSRARLMLRVNREGYYITNNDINESYQNGSKLPIIKDPELADAYNMADIRGIGAKPHDDNVVIGTNIRKIHDQDPDSITLENGGLFLENKHEPVYRVGYKVYLKAIRREFDPNSNTYKIKDKMKIELPLSAVMPDRRKVSETISDRLIFENEFSEFLDEETLKKTAKYFNEFELQIYWRTEYGDFFTSDKYKEHFLGRIHDLVLTFDKSI